MHAGCPKISQMRKEGLPPRPVWRASRYRRELGQRETRASQTAVALSTRRHAGEAAEKPLVRACMERISTQRKRLRCGVTGAIVIHVFQRACGQTNSTLLKVPTRARTPLLSTDTRPVDRKRKLPRRDSGEENSAEEREREREHGKACFGLRGVTYGTSQAAENERHLLVRRNFGRSSEEIYKYTRHVDADGSRGECGDKSEQVKTQGKVFSLEVRVEREDC